MAFYETPFKVLKILAIILPKNLRFECSHHHVFSEIKILLSFPFSLSVVKILTLFIVHFCFIHVQGQQMS